MSILESPTIESYDFSISTAKGFSKRPAALIATQLWAHQSTDLAESCDLPSFRSRNSFPCRDIAFWSLDVHFHLGFIKRGPGMIWNNNSHGESNPTFGKVKTISVDCDFQHTIDSYWLDEYPCSDLRVLIHVHYSTNLRKVTFYWFWTTGMDTAPEQSPELSS